MKALDCDDEEGRLDPKCDAIVGCRDFFHERADIHTVCVVNHGILLEWMNDTVR